MTKAFISYSHRDEAALERLHAHLAILRRDGGLMEWYDREILAGGDIDAEIQEQLETCDLFLALISPDFLNSDYCYNREMGRAMERHEAGEIVIVPIIVQPCDWQNTPLQRFKAVPKDGQPISEWVNENTAYLDVVNELRRLTQRAASTENVEPPGTQRAPQPEPQRYRAQRDFDDIDRADFRNSAFREMQDFFERSISELDQVEGLRGRFNLVNASGFTCTVINQMRQRQGKAHITVRTSGDGGGMGDIYYSFNERAPENTANGWFSIESDDYDLFLAWNNFAGGNDRERLSPRQAAEALWGEFVRLAGIDYE